MAHPLFGSPVPTSRSSSAASVGSLLPFLVLPAGAALVVAACSGSPPPRPTIACLVAPAGSNRPVLLRAGAEETNPEHPLLPRESPSGFSCGPARTKPCPLPDDYDAMLNGSAGTPTHDGGDPVKICPSIPQGTARDEKPWRDDRPCSGAFANKQLVLHTGTLSAHVLFYDDPECRQAAADSNMPLPQVPYYRVWEVSGINWTGEGWK